jgi:hypothetical protein
VLVISQIAYLGIVVQIIWNYNHKFTLMLQYYTVYQIYTCLCAVLNSRYEQYISALILTIAIAVQYCVKVII